MNSPYVTSLLSLFQIELSRFCVLFPLPRLPDRPHLLLRLPFSEIFTFITRAHVVGPFTPVVLSEMRREILANQICASAPP